MTDYQFYIDAGRRLRELREDGLNETPAQFAKRFGISTRDYLAYEDGRRSRGWTRHLKALGETGVSLDWLFDWTAGRAMFRGGRPGMVGAGQSHGYRRRGARLS